VQKSISTAGGKPQSSMVVREQLKATIEVQVQDVQRTD